MLELINISKKYGRKEVLKDVSITFKNGIYGLIGPNGAGKTTIMNIMANVIQQSSGYIKYNNDDIKKIGNNYRAKIGYLPQKVGYYDNFTAYEMLIYFANLKGLNLKGIDSEIYNMLETVNLKDVALDKVATFSGGMKQRLGIATVLLGNPDILILDEPTVGLDPKERIQFRNTLSNISSDKTIILSTHIVSDVENIAQYIVMMKKGHIILDDTYENAMCNIRGKMWSADIDDNKLGELSGKYHIVNIGRLNNGIRRIDFFSDFKPNDIICYEKLVDLQDLYVYMYN